MLVPVAGIGAALSFDSLYRAAIPTFGRSRALGFPLLADMLILGSSLAYLAGVVRGRARIGWRWTAHGGVAGTLLLNCMAATPTTIGWHITAPAVWSVLVEMTSRQVLAGNRVVPTSPAEPIPARLWFGAPREAARIWMYMTRRGEPRYRRAASAVAIQTAAAEALRIALPSVFAFGVRRTVARQLRAGTLTSRAVLEAVGWQPDGGGVHARTRAEVLQAVLVEILSNVADGGQRESLQSRRRPQTAIEQSASTSHQRAPAGNEARRIAASEILQSQPEIAGPQLAQELTAAGWKVSQRTAARMLAALRNEHTYSATPD